MDRRPHRSSRRDGSSRDEVNRRTKLNRDNSTRPSQYQQHKDEPSREDLNQRTKLIRDQGTRPSQSHQRRDESNKNEFGQRTKLNRDHSRPSQSQQDRIDLSNADQRTKLNRDNSTRPSRSHHRKQESSHTPSILRTDRDETMASRQTRIQSLAPVERQEQEKWAQKQIQLTGACVGNRPWTRVEGGYRCASGNCKITDQLLAEEGGGFMHAMPRITTAFPNLFDEGNITWVGPFYRGHLGNRIQAPAPAPDFFVEFP
jgi:hypothetical protein